LPILGGGISKRLVLSPVVNGGDSRRNIEVKMKDHMRGARDADFSEPSLPAAGQKYKLGDSRAKAV